MVDGERILGFAWSDDLMMFVEADKMEQVLRRLEAISGRYKKKTNDAKVFVTPLCPKPTGSEHPPLFLGGAPLKYKPEEKMLGFILSQSIKAASATPPSCRAGSPWQ